MPVTRRDRLDKLQAESRLGQAVRKEFTTFAGRVVPSLKRRARKDTGAFSNSIKSRIAGWGLETNLRIYADSANAQYVEYGRGPGKQPPPDKILAWVQRRGISGNHKSIAFLIGRAIARRGIKGQYLFRDVPTDYEPEISRMYARMRIAAVESLNG